MADLLATDLHKSFPTGEAQSLEILTGVSLQLSAGENLAILGPSGSGKSTLLAILGTLDRPTSGTVRLADVDPFGLGEAELARFRSRHVGFVFQDHYLLPQCTVLENVLTPFLAEGAAGPNEVAHAQRLIERVGLKARSLHRPAQLSGGERQRAAIARALVRNPSLLLADEPTGNLDRTTAASIAELLVEIQQEQQTMLVAVTHSLDLAVLMLRRLELNAGRLEATA
jgi:lipoprotein-releasing system ATP-binding protein